jgi:hypothetical protein
MKRRRTGKEALYTRVVEAEPLRDRPRNRKHEWLDVENDGQDDCSDEYRASQNLKDLLHGNE